MRQLLITLPMVLALGCVSRDGLPPHRMAEAYTVMSVWAGADIGPLDDCHPDRWRYVEDDDSIPSRFGGRADVAWTDDGFVAIIRIAPSRASEMTFRHEVIHVLEGCSLHRILESDHDDWKGPIWGPNGVIEHVSRGACAAEPK